MLWLGVNYARCRGGSDRLVVVIEGGCGGSGSGSKCGRGVVVVVIEVVIVARRVSVVRCDGAARRCAGI